MKGWSDGSDRIVDILDAGRVIDLCVAAWAGVLGLMLLFTSHPAEQFLGLVIFALGQVGIWRLPSPSWVNPVGYVIAL